MKSLPRFECISMIFVPVRMALSRAWVRGYEGQQESDVARLASEAVWLCNIID